MVDDENDILKPVDADLGAYDHTQRGIIHHVLWILGVSLIVGAFAGMAHPAAVYGMAVGGVISFVATFTFCHLRVRDMGDYLSARFGPVGCFGTRIRYADITGVEVYKLTTLDGIGVHYTLSKGWLFNIRGGECVTVTLAGGKKRSIGTDEPERLAGFLRAKMPGHGGEAGRGDA